MAGSRRSSGRSEANIWPGFVDAMTALLLVMMFVLSIFMIIQFALRETITGQETELNDLNVEVVELADALGLERRRGAELVSQLNDSQAEITLQASIISGLTTERDQALNEITAFEAQVATLLAQNNSLSERNNILITNLNTSENRLSTAQQQLELAGEELETAQAQIDARDQEIAIAEANLAALRENRDQEITAREAAELALLQARQEIDSGVERARLAAARADALQALVEELQQDAEQSDTIIRALDQAEAARVAEAAAAEALRKRLAESETELTAMTLALEEQRRNAEETLTLLAAAEAARNDLNNSQAENIDEITRQRALVAQANAMLSEEREVSAAAQRQVTLLNQQIAALRQQLTTLQAILDEAKERDREAQVQMQTLGADLNAALAQVAAEQRSIAELEARERERAEEEARRLEEEAKDLRAFRSEFFGRISQILNEREGIQVVGDRFVFSSEVLFAPGSAVLGAGGRAQITSVAEVIRDIADQIPSEIDWILRVDGHTDKIQVGSSSEFADNWELSQARALSVVKYLIEVEEIPANRLAATGFGEFQPISLGDSPEDLALNRRIELKLTEK